MPEKISTAIHQDLPVFTAGKPLEKARAALVLLHGRGASAHSILGLSRYLAHPDLSYLAPQAAENTWWPQRFLDPIDQNEIWLYSALQVVDDLIQRIQRAGIQSELIFVGGFSQGAILATEYVASHAQRYGGLFILSGGLFGPPGTEYVYSGSLQGTPVFIGCDEFDPYIPLWRVEETADKLTQLGGAVTKKIYSGMGHIINEDEMLFMQQTIDTALA